MRHKTTDVIVRKQLIVSMLAISLLLIFVSSGTVSAYSGGAPLSANSSHSTPTQASHTETQTTTTTLTSTSSNMGGQNKQSHELKYRMIGIHGQGEANIQIHGTDLNVNVEIEHARNSTTYSVVLIAIQTSSGGTGFGTSGVGTSGVSTTTPSINVCKNPIGVLVTSKVGQGIAHLDTSLQPGTYQMGVLLCRGNIPAIISRPITQQGIITQGQNDNSAMTDSVQTVQPINLDSQQSQKLQHAENDGSISAVVNGGNSLGVANMNSNYSTAIGRLGASGVIISISSSGSDGPGAILVNLGNVPITSVLKGIAATMNGVPVSAASSIDQVLSPSSGQPAYVLLKTSSGLELLMSLPNIADNIIQILPVLSYNVIFISMAALGSIAVVGAVLFMYRKRSIPFPVFR